MNAIAWMLNGAGATVYALDVRGHEVRVGVAIWLLGKRPPDRKAIWTLVGSPIIRDEALYRAESVQTCFSPHFFRARRTGPNSRPFAVRKYSSRGGWSAYGRLSMTALDSSSFNRADRTLGVKPGRVASKSWKRRVSYLNKSRRIRMAHRSPMTSSVRATGHLRSYFLAISNLRSPSVYQHTCTLLVTMLIIVTIRSATSKKHYDSSSYSRFCTFLTAGDQLSGPRG
jgi:hypothetical protein